MTTTSRPVLALLLALGPWLLPACAAPDGATPVEPSAPLAVEPGAEAPARKTAFNSLSWSPDGRSLLVTAIDVAEDWSDYDVGRWELLLVDAVGGSATRLETGVLHAAFSPDGRRVAYSRDVDGNRELLLRELQGDRWAEAGATTLATHPAKESGPSFSPDGRQLVFSSQRDGKWALYVLELSTGDLRRLTDPGHASLGARWEPGGDRIVYYRVQGDANDQVRLTDGQGSFDRDVTADEHHNIYPGWAPGGRIVYARSPDEIVVTSADGARREVLEGVRGSQPRFSPDGRALAVIDERTQAIVVHDLEAGTSRSLSGPGSRVAP